MRDIIHNWKKQSRQLPNFQGAKHPVKLRSVFPEESHNISGIMCNGQMRPKWIFLDLMAIKIFILTLC